ncbi:hypothetical protein OIU85_004453 [Salix viminalis]|uniref:Uncharacterized protein n=1 Tax=Salix viminalis TaxID=40686 RepID=A0A9Q0SXT4_SALVM|nr:hypothetical protein OIU85_004453 [Salix viminalis]
MEELLSHSICKVMKFRRLSSLLKDLSECLALSTFYGQSGWRGTSVRFENFKPSATSWCNGFSIPDDSLESRGISILLVGLMRPAMKRAYRLVYSLYSCQNATELFPGGSPSRSYSPVLSSFSLLGE